MGYPVSDTNQLYIEVGHYGVMKMTDILERANAHFEGGCKIEELSISPEDIQVEGCHCCYDASNYRMFLCVTLERETE